MIAGGSGTKRRDFSVFAVTGPYDFRMLCAVTSRVGRIKFPEREEEIEKLYKECQALNDKRVHIAHGLWNDGLEEFSVRVFNRQKLDAAYYPYSSEELYALGDKAQDLMQRVMGFQPKPEDSSTKVADD